MPSPFPGMDPYLEGSYWSSVHTHLSVEIVRLLGPRLRPRYVAMTNRRFVLDIADHIGVASADMYPDAVVYESGSKTTGNKESGIATAPLQMATVMPEPVPLVSVEIRDVENRARVTSIEVLSPVNKRGTGRQEYLAKRRRVLLSTAHLLEIDFLREGHRVPMQQPLPPASYFVFLGRSWDRPVTEVWPIHLGERLPTVPVPLLDGDPDVALDLQQALTAVYDECSFDLVIDYTKPSEVPLSPEFAEWADERLRAAGLRH